MKGKRRTRLTVTGWFRFARLLTGAGIVAGFALQYAEQFNIPVPEVIAGQLDSFYGWGDGKTYFGLGAGVALFLSAFSVRTLASVVISIGAVLMVTLNPIVEFADQPQFTDTTAFWGAAGLVAAGVGYLIMGKLTGGKF